MTEREPTPITASIIPGVLAAAATFTSHGLTLCDTGATIRPYILRHADGTWGTPMTTLETFERALALAQTPTPIQAARAKLFERRIYTYSNRQYPGLFDLVHPGLPRRDGLNADEIIRYAETLK
jgi:hypothetical protein